MKVDIKLSYSRYRCWKSGKKQYYKQYILGEKMGSRYMEFGSYFAKLLEDDSESGEDEIERVRAFIPTYKTREKVIEVKHAGVPLLIKPDGLDLKKHIIGEFKTGKRWNQRMADESEQITFYAFVYWLTFKKIPKTYLHWVETRVAEDGGIEVTGYAETFDTPRTMEDFLKLFPKLKTAYREIVEFTKSEYAKI